MTENNMSFAEIKNLYDEYIAKAEKLESERKPADGLFGMGKKTADDPCHEQFANDLEAMIKSFAESKPDSGKVYEVMEYIYRMSDEHKEPLTVYWMLNAVHGLTLEMMELLGKDDAEKLYGQYRKTVPRWKRLPVQKKVCSELDKRRK
jgi:hypothetical protein